MHLVSKAPAPEGVQQDFVSERHHCISRTATLPRSAMSFIMRSKVEWSRGVPDRRETVFCWVRPQRISNQWKKQSSYMHLLRGTDVHPCCSSDLNTWKRRFGSRLLGTVDFPELLITIAAGHMPGSGPSAAMQHLKDGAVSLYER